jgi:hypothetical protein
VLRVRIAAPGDRRHGFAAKIARISASAGGGIEDDAQRELVRPSVDGSSADLLRGHVARGPEDAPLLGGERGLGRRIARDRVGALVDLGEAEVEDLHLSFAGHHHVLGLQVAVDHTHPVRPGEPTRDLRADARDLAERKSAPTREGAQRPALDELHGHEDAPAVLAELVHGRDARVRRRRRRPRLAEEPRATLPVADERARQHLERHAASERHVLGAVHDAHPTSADERQDAVAPKRGADEIVVPARRLTTRSCRRAHAAAKVSPRRPARRASELRRERSRCVPAPRPTARAKRAARRRRRSGRPLAMRALARNRGRGARASDDRAARPNGPLDA